jgi:8-oxo-dGTP diphosphatase
MNRPLVGIAVAIRRENKVLLHKRKGKHAPGMWAFPGGHLEFWETFEECVMREVREEAGDIQIDNIKFWTAVNYLHSDEKKHYVTILLVADWVSGEAEVREPEKCEGWEWLVWDDLPDPLMLGLQFAKDTGLNPFNV